MDKKRNLTNFGRRQPIGWGHVNCRRGAELRKKRQRGWYRVGETASEIQVPFALFCKAFLGPSAVQAEPHPH